MRTIGFLLVLVGALALGYQEFLLPVRVDAGDSGAGQVPGKRKPVSIPPVVGGIPLVGGLLLLTLSLRRGGA